MDAKLNRAKKRREKASKKLETVLNDKNEQAFQRAQKTIAKRKENSRKKNKKVKRVHERLSLQEKRRRSSALRSLDNRVNSALTRAEENLKKKQVKARKEARIAKVQKKRALIEFERRSALLESLGHKAERAARNLQLRLEDLQGKARVEIKHAQIIAKRVRAARIIQKLVRAKFGFEVSAGPSQRTLNEAAVKLQTSMAWRSKVTVSRLLKNHKTETFKSLVATIMDRSAVLTFEQITFLITNAENIAIVNSFLDAFALVLPRAPNNDLISARTLLSVFLVSTQPAEVLGEKRGKDKCSNLLEKAAAKLVTILHEFSKVDLSQNCDGMMSKLFCQMSSQILSYCTLFNHWKNADLNDLIDKMTTSAIQSWVAYLTSKEALAYIEEKCVDQIVHFQHLLKHKSSKKGAGSHIKRIRASMRKILGEKHSLSAMNGAKAKAILLIKDKKLMVPIKAEIDNAMNAFMDTSDESSSRSTIQSEQGGILPENIQSNAKLVHQLLLMDNDDFDDLMKVGSKNFSYLDNLENFMLQFKNHNASQWVEQSSTVDGMKKLILELIEKMRKLVPNRSDLHNHFTECHVQDCKCMTDFFQLVLSMADVMAKNLESKNSSVVTNEWSNTTASWIASKDPNVNVPFGFTCWKTYLIASLTFLIGKADLCQVEIFNFQLVQVAPVVKAHGKEYETHRFQQKYGNFSSLQSKESFSATWSWIKRICEKNYNEDVNLQLRKGFVDEILFAQDAIQIPEVSQIHEFFE